MLNSTEELEERPFTREIYNYLRKMEMENSKENLKNEIGNVFVAKCKTKCLSEPKSADVKIFNEKIREILRNSKTNTSENKSFEKNIVYEIKNEDLDQSVLVDTSLKENSENFVKPTEKLITNLSWDGENTTCNEKTHPDAVFENVNQFSKLLGPYPDEPFLAAFDKCISLILRQDQ